MVKGLLFVGERGAPFRHSTFDRKRTGNTLFGSSLHLGRAQPGLTVYVNVCEESLPPALVTVTVTVPVPPGE